MRFYNPNKSTNLLRIPQISKQNLEQVKQYLQVTGLKLAILINFMPNGVKYIRVLNPNNLQKINS